MRQIESRTRFLGLQGEKSLTGLLSLHLSARKSSSPAFPSPSTCAVYFFMIIVKCARYSVLFFSGSFSQSEENEKKMKKKTLITDHRGSSRQRACFGFVKIYEDGTSKTKENPCCEKISKWRNKKFKKFDLLSK